MNKQNLIDQVASSLQIEKKKTKEVIEAMLQSLGEALKDGEEVRLSGFGLFKVIETKERTGRNPATGEVITIPAGKRVKFSAYKELKESV